MWNRRTSGRDFVSRETSLRVHRERWISPFSPDANDGVAVTLLPTPNEKSFREESLVKVALICLEEKRNWNAATSWVD